MHLQNKQSVDFDAIRLKVASPEVVREWSFGEITKAETINYRTQKPERDGLFDEKIFGPSKDWECSCGKYKKIRYKGIVCDKCGVEVTHSSVRRERMAHIELAAPVTHIWFLRGVPSRLGLLLNVSAQALEKVIYFASFIVTQVDEGGRIEALTELKDEYKSMVKQIESKYKNQIKQINDNKDLKPEEKKNKVASLVKVQEEEIEEIAEEFTKTEKELKDLEPKQIISENTYQDLSLKFGHLFEARIGAEAIYDLLSHIDLPQTITELNEELENTTSAKKEKLQKRLQLYNNLHKNNIRPEHMLLTALPVIPPDLRPMVSLDGGRFATSDLNDLYRRVINRNNRLRKLQALNAPEVIMRNEKRMLQEAVDALFDNSARATKTTVASTGQKRQLKSLADLLKGKQGRFRQNLLGKRIDYSGRSVIVVGPNLQLHQCGLPKRMALELFKPFVISQLIKREYVHNIRSANKFIEANRPEIWDILEEVVADAHVLLNRAPTLHRLGIQAFQPTLIEGKAIRLHPLVCSAFNADFDGDQMAVHVPLTDQAKWEAAEIMRSDKNLLKPADGRPVVTPKMDIVWGLFYITDMDEVETPRVFANAKEAKLAADAGVIRLQDKITVRVEVEPGKVERIETCVGRLLFNEVVPEGIPYFNERIDSKKLSDFTNFILEKMGKEMTAKFLDACKNLGYHHLTLSGYSWAMADLPTIDEKPAIIKEGEETIEKIEKQFQSGLLTRSERYAKIIETWTEVKDRVVALTKESLDPKGSVYSMITAGARGSWGQVVQMVGMKGLVASPSGEIIELPVKGNFKAGFDILEYYISTHGSRKGLTDTALRTANAGYLTRRLVDVAQDVVVTHDDCGDKHGLVYTKAESDEIGVKLLDRVWGRITFDDIKDPATGEVVVKKGEHIDKESYRQLVDTDLEEVRVRSVLSCLLPKGICQKCYGYDLGHNAPVGLGMSAGIVAAQSIGEPGTQLTMRTFHSGGVAGGDDITQGLPRVEELFEARIPKRKAFLAEESGVATVSDLEIEISDQSGTAGASKGKVIRIKFEAVDEDEYKFEGEAKVKVKDGAEVKRGEVLFKDESGEVKAKKKGIARVLKTMVKVVVEAEKEKEYIIPPGTRIRIKDGDFVGAGDQLTDGSVDMQQLFKIKGKDAVKRYIVEEIQYIYSSQGQRLNEKHIEVIIRQLFSRLLVKDSGDTNLITGEVVERAEFEAENKRAKKTEGQEAKADQLFLGISKVSLSTQSFLSAASFQETSKVLINAATTGRIDRLEGLKENVIIGRLIPAGTGFDPESVKE
jgi:DNA-directed RNA polymerase subunit beta'